MSNNQDKINDAFKKFNQRMDELKANLPAILAKEAENDTLDNFKKESFNGVPWQKRKGKDQARNLLVKSGALRRSPQVYGYKSNGFTLGSDLPHAAVHNYGLTIKRSARSETFTRNRATKGIKKGQFRKGTNAGQGFTFKAYQYKMPQRQFIGDNIGLRTRLYKAAKEEYLKIIAKP